MPHLEWSGQLGLSHVPLALLRLPSGNQLLRWKWRQFAPSLYHPQLTLYPSPCVTSVSTRSVVALAREGFQGTVWTFTSPPTDKVKKFLTEFYADGDGGKDFTYARQLTAIAHREQVELVIDLDDVADVSGCCDNSLAAEDV